MEVRFTELLGIRLVVMKLARHSAICSKEYLHAAPLQSVKTAIEKSCPVRSVRADTMWNTENLSHLHLSHAVGNLGEFVLGNSIAGNEEHREGDAAEQQSGKHDSNLGLALHCSVMMPNDATVVRVEHLVRRRWCHNQAIMQHSPVLSSTRTTGGWSRGGTKFLGTGGPAYANST